MHIIYICTKNMPILRRCFFAQGYNRWFSCCKQELKTQEAFEMTEPEEIESYG